METTPDNVPYWKSVLRRFGAIFFSILSVIVSFIIIALMFAPFGGGDPTNGRTHLFGEESSGNQLLSVPVNGVILGEGDGGLSFLSEGIAPGYDIKSELYAAAEDEAIKGIVLEVNSPGGTIYGAKAIADGVAYYKQKTNKPVIAQINGMAASGGIWAAVAADSVYADQGSSIGSIGIVMGPFKYYDQPISEDGGLLMGGVVTHNGIETVTLTAGRSKDIGNPYRRLTTEEIATLQGSINDEYATFVQYVAGRRKIEPAVITDQMGAMIYSNKAAQEFRIIDGTKSREETYAELAKQASLNEDDYQVVRQESTPTFIASLLGAVTKGNYGPKAHSEVQQKQAAVTCAISNGMLAYHGEVGALCSK